jgi:acid phosphatase
MPQWTHTAMLARTAGLLIVLFGAGCGGTVGGALSPNPSPPPSSSHVFLVVEENHSYSQVIGNSAMPYFNGLASKYGLATHYFADAHPSLGNYFMLTTGQIETLIDAFTGTVSDDNVVRELVSVNKTWHSYAESLPNPGYLGGDVYPYVKHHNPFAYLVDVVGTPQASNIVPFSQFATDLSNGSLPDFSFIVPNLLNDAHDGTLAAADQWLATNIDPLIRSSAFQQSGLLIVVFDESVSGDLAHGGGHVPMVIVGPQVKSGFQSTTFYQHESTLRVVLSTLGVTSFPGAASSAPDMGKFFK